MVLAKVCEEKCTTNKQIIIIEKQVIVALTGPNMSENFPPGKLPMTIPNPTNIMINGTRSGFNPDSLITIGAI